MPENKKAADDTAAEQSVAAAVAEGDAPETTPAEERVEVMLLVPRSGIEGAQNRGDVVRVSPGEARRMIEAGQAAAPGGRKETTAKGA